MIETLSLYQSVLKASLNTAELGRLDTALRECLRAAQLEANVLLPQMLLLDSRLIVLNAIVLAPPDFDDDKRTRLEQWGLSQLGHQFSSAIPTHATYIKLLQEATVKHDGYGHLFLSADKPVRHSNGTVIGDYTIFQLQPGATSPDGFSAKVGSAEIAIASGYNADLLSALGMLDWFQNIVLSVIAAEPTDARSKMYGILAFLYRPSEHSKSFDSCITHLYSIRERISFLSSFLQASQFASWMQSIGQASGDEPSRLTTELLHVGWGRLLQTEISRCLRDDLATIWSRDLRRLMTTILSMRNPLATRRILRESVDASNDSAAFANSALRYFSAFLGGASESTRDWEPALAELRSAVPPAPNDGTESAWDDRLRHAINATVHNIRYFYRCVDQDTFNSFFHQSILPFVRSMCSCLNNTNGVPSMIDHDVRFQLATVALEDSFSRVDEGGWVEICKLLKELIVVTAASPNLLEQFIEFALEALIHSDEDSVPVLAEIVQLLLLSWDKSSGGLPFRNAHKLFRLLPIRRRATVLSRFKQLPIRCHEQFIKAERDQATLARTTEVSQDALTPLEIFSVVSCKGGVGKTTVSMALAIAISQKANGDREQTNKVCLIDLDIFGPTLAYCAGPRLPHYYLNDAVLAGFINSADLCADDARATDWMSRVFEHRSYLRDRVVGLSREKNILSHLLVKPGNLGGVHMILCSPDEDSQDLMLPFIESSSGRKAFIYQIYNLLLLLRADGFTHIVIDNSAELKELAIDATEISGLHGGKTVFVTTLSQNSISPLISMLTSGHNIIGNNYLLVNKLRTIDAQYIDSKEGILDYLDARQDGICEDAHTYARLSSLLNVKQCGSLLWSENLENLISRRQDTDKDVHRVIRDSAASQVAFVLSKERFTNS